MLFKSFIFILALATCSSAPVAKSSIFDNIFPKHVETEKAGDSNIVVLKGVIDEDTAEIVLGALAKIDGPAELRINSRGGEVPSMYDVIDALYDHPGSTCVCYGDCSSAAGIILLSPSCEHKVMRPMAQLLVHQPAVGSEGNVGALHNSEEELKQLEDAEVTLIHARTKLSECYIHDKISNGKWWIIGADEALKLHLIDEIK